MLARMVSWMVFMRNPRILSIVLSNRADPPTPAAAPPGPPSRSLMMLCSTSCNPGTLPSTPLSKFSRFGGADPAAASEGGGGPLGWTTCPICCKM